MTKGKLYKIFEGKSIKVFPENIPYDPDIQYTRTITSYLDEAKKEFPYNEILIDYWRNKSDDEKKEIREFDSSLARHSSPSMYDMMDWFFKWFGDEK